MSQPNRLYYSSKPLSEENDGLKIAALITSIFDGAILALIQNGLPGGKVAIPIAIEFSGMSSNAVQTTEVIIESSGPDFQGYKVTVASTVLTVVASGAASIVVNAIALAAAKLIIGAAAGPVTLLAIGAVAGAIGYYVSYALSDRFETIVDSIFGTTDVYLEIFNGGQLDTSKNHSLEAVLLIHCGCLAGDESDVGSARFV